MSCSDPVRPGADWLDCHVPTSGFPAQPASATNDNDNNALKSGALTMSSFARGCSLASIVEYPTVRSDAVAGAQRSLISFARRCAAWRRCVGARRRRLLDLLATGGLSSSGYLPEDRPLRVVLAAGSRSRGSFAASLRRARGPSCRSRSAARAPAARSRLKSWVYAGRSRLRSNPVALTSGARTTACSTCPCSSS